MLLSSLLYASSNLLSRFEGKVFYLCQHLCQFGLVDVICLALQDRESQTSNSRGSKEGGERDFHVETFLYLCQNAGSLEGVPSQLEKIVLDANRSRPQLLFPQRGQVYLSRRARGQILLVPQNAHLLWDWQRHPIHFVVGGQGEHCHWHKDGWNHVI